MASTNIWAQMGYVPPRGACNHKESILSSKCSCLRFMIHPMKATTSFDCDGCSHHASFHTMDNPLDTETIKRWAAAEQDNAATMTTAGTIGAGGSRKRQRREIENGNSFVEESAGPSGAVPRRKAAAAAKGTKKRDTRSARVVEVDELEEEEEDVVEEVRSGMIGGFFTRR
ncbi:hypothetical protein EG328_003883 [Venturia inaequalis]|uniref:Uncharacterized protein n=1 Tax=Venturia inaequalis TaxID=5025 RepID=A0A8H3ZCB0_VENIN|nr:hypothetical protein EG328_003883 [Venturia inaequalis]KAE9987830.1 hypothetical protein EG327_003621 [Venturia inaequalis]RDI80302.1 hypothetical protein Vi05172_g9693 [Venturia inaequalis]